MEFVPFYHLGLILSVTLPQRARLCPRRSQLELEMGRIGVSQSPPPFVTKFRDASFGAAFRPDAADSKRGDAPREVTRAHGVSGSPKRRHGKPCKEDAPNDLDCGDEKRRSVRQRDESGGPGRDRSRVWQPAPHPILADSLAQIFF